MKDKRINPMTISKCRVCGQELNTEPLLRYENMPRAAQYLPNESELDTDKGIDLEVCQCSGCGLIQLNSEPVPYYQEVIRAADVSGEMKEFRRKQFIAFVQKYSLRDKKVIEIGCGQGEYLTIMQAAGAKAYGLEQSAESVAQCQKKGLNVIRGFMQAGGAPLTDAPFAAFYCLNYLEHLPDPNSMLRGISMNLPDGGIGLVEVPNIDMILRKNLFAEFIADHLLYFTRETLTTTLKINGFDVIEANEEWHEYIISAVVRKRKKTAISGFYDNQRKLKNEIDAYLGRYKPGEVAVWGAGHQALTVISLFKLAGKIKYVIDSAPFKQGKYTPATHIRIVSPEALVADPVKAVIVMAASYSDEVAMILREKHGKKIGISVLRDYGLEIIH